MGLNINVTYDASVANAPTGFQAAVQAAVAYWESVIATSVTINIVFGYGVVAGQPLDPGALAESFGSHASYSYAQIAAAMGSASTSYDDAVAMANLRADPANGAPYYVSTGEAKALGLFTGSPTAVDGWVGLAADAAFTFDPNNRGVAGKYDAIGALEHEISEILGRISFAEGASSPNVTPLDLFRHGWPDSSAYFSIDGRHDLIPFNVQSFGDSGDWAEGQNTDSFSVVATPGVAQVVSQTDLRVMDVLGYAVAPHFPATAGNDYLVGGTGADRLDGGAGADLMFGGPGDDTYVVDHQGDIVGELPGQGTDTVEVHGDELAATYTLPDNVENLVLISGYDATGNALDNVITGDAAANVIDGGLGADTMRGGAGNDEYMVDNPGDLVVENAGEGTDWVDASISYALPSNVENLFFSFTAGPVTGTGNALDNIITGNNSGDTLIGGGGADTINGGDGADLITTDAGTDTITSGAGADVIDSGGGNDTIDSGPGDDHVSAGDGNDQVHGQLGADVIDGGAGADTLWGDLGADTLLGGAGDDRLNGGSFVGFDFIGANYRTDEDFARDTLTGGPGNDVLDGAGGIDTSVYFVAAAAAIVTRHGDGSWTVNAGADGVDTLTNVELLQFTDRTISLVAELAQWSDFTGQGRSDLLIQNASGAVVMGQVSGGQANFTALAALGPEWSFRGNGDFLGDGFGRSSTATWSSLAQVSTTSPAQFLIENANGAVVVGDLTNGHISYTQVGALGPEWTFKGVGDFLQHGDDQFLIENANGAVVVGEVVGGQANYTPIAALGSEWSFRGVGDFLGDGRSDFLIQNTAGAVVVGEVAGGQTHFTQVAALGPEWTFVGAGDVFGDGRTGFLLESATGAVVFGEVVNGQAAYTQLGALGPEWTFKGVADYLGEGHDQLLIEKANGAVVVGDYLGGLIHYTQVGGLGPEWQFHL